MKKSKLKTTLIVLIILISLILCVNVVVYAAYALAATEVSYTKSDGTTVSVKAALDELYAKEKINETEKAVGEEVTVGGEQFYVLEWMSGSNVATLISKYNLNTAGTAQENAAYDTTKCAFSTTNYWSSSFTDNTFKLFNLNDFSGYQSTDAIGKAKSYGRSIGAVSSRLLSYEEANALNTKASSDTKIYNMLWGNANSANGYLYYWLGSAYNTEYVYIVNGRYGFLGNDLFSNVEKYGVRPVITVLKSSIS